ncbi:MAG TPA: tricarballylate utilization 4Fe-4S protein TcuB [Acidimicrobiales bacterium]|nr:tricarballylate utilization 4Fe-4S protein TcuB [Acidimicrobiales bacterium]
MTFADEARRQLDICNACRFCEGYCAVYPALERRINLTDGDLTQLANLCHDCRACYYACMYAPPHEFALNPPRLLAELRRESFSELIPLARLGGRGRPLAVVVAVTAALVGVLAGSGRFGALTASHPSAASPYSLVPFAALDALGIASALVALLVFALGARNYLRHVGPPPPGARPLAALARAAHDALTLRWLRSAGVECTYPSAEGSPARRRAHGLLAGGFVLALAATVVAAIDEDLLSSPPPYGLLQAPVVLGFLGGVAMLAGGLALLALKRRADPAPADAPTLAADHALLGTLLVLALTGLATLLARRSPAYGVLLAVHLDAVFSAFVLAPFSKFAHVVYRFAALVRDEEERALEAH